VSPRPDWIDLEGVVNARDVGGLPTIDGRTTRSGVLLRTAHLQNPTDADVVRLLEEIGVRTVLDLRTDAERRSEGPGPLADRVTHHNLSLVLSLPDADATSDAAVDQAVPGAVRPQKRPLVRADMAAHYIGYLTNMPHNIAAALRVIADPASGPTIVHCAAGKDRTGTVVALALSLVGVTREAVVADYVATAERIADVVESLRRSVTYGEQMADVEVDRIRPLGPAMESFLDHIDATYGGVHALAAAIGVDEETVARLGVRLVGPSR
ncbi:MAG: tyrosine-protein phosphatase, partial [Frankiales bacterium]|nr:tyrosine-protein phosphatase [Frankiales bacterium]